jgi:hypothetical protein
MTALNISTQIPSQIDTVEKLASWALMTLATVNPTLTVLETQNSGQIRAQASLFRNADGTMCILLRANLPVDSNIFSDRSKKSWQFTQELTNTVIPTNFTAN